MSFQYNGKSATKTTEKPRLTILVGLPGSGKTTWRKMKVAQGYKGVVINPDEVRKRVFAVYSDPKKSTTFGNTSTCSCGARLQMAKISVWMQLM